MRSAFVLSFVALAGCSFAARSPEMYKKDTEKLLATKTPAIKACYDEQLKGNPGLTGRATVKFEVEPSSGKLTHIAVDAGGTTVPDALAQCVVHAIEGLTLNPGDQKQGVATFSYEFKK